MEFRGIMKQGKLGYVVFLLLAAVLVYFGIRLYPVWKAAVYLKEHLDMAHYTYELELDLDREALPEGSGRVLGILKKLTGLSEKDIYHLTVRGEVWENMIHVLVFPGDLQEPLMELYLSDATDVIYQTMLYNAVRQNLTEKYGLLKLVMPEQKETLYITLEQTEQLFGLDLKQVRDFRLERMDDNIAAGGYFLLLAAMSREKEGDLDCFTLTMDQVEIQFEIPKEGCRSPLKISLKVQNPSELTGKAAAAASRMGFPAGKELAMVKRFAITMTSGSEEIVMPGNFVNQTIIELLSQIREWVTQLFNDGADEIFENQPV